MNDMAEKDLYAFVAKNPRYFILSIGVNYHTQKALLQILHDPNIGGLTKDKKELYKFFKETEQQVKVKQLVKKMILNSKHKELLLPTTTNEEILSEKWDVTLICVVIKNFTNFSPLNEESERPVTITYELWKKNEDLNDIAKNVNKAHSELRNDFNHGTVEEKDEEIEFKKCRLLIIEVLTALSYKHLQDFSNLKVDVDLKKLLDGIEDPEQKEEFVDQLKEIWDNYNEKSMYIGIILGTKETFYLKAFF